MEKFEGSLSEDGKTWYFPIINNVPNFWQIYVRVYNNQLEIPSRTDLDKFEVIKPEYFDNFNEMKGLTGWFNVDFTTSKKTIKISKPTIVVTGKNLDKKNRTNVLIQALSEARSKYKNYLRSTGFNSEGMLPPMLASSKSTDANFPKFIQPKYNGVRCVWTRLRGVITAHSRSCHILNVDSDLSKAIDKIMPTGVSFDGELYLHGMSLQEIVGRVTSGKTTELNYVLFDIINNDKQDVRFQLLETIIPENARIIKAPIYLVNNKEEELIHYNNFIQEDLEGAMIRLNEHYEYSHKLYHSPNLVKMKPHFDAEYKVIGHTISQNGHTRGAVIITCEVDGAHFEVTPSLPIKKRVELVENFDQEWIGKFIIVYYDELSDARIPLRARTKLELPELK